MPSAADAPTEDVPPDPPPSRAAAVFAFAWRQWWLVFAAWAFSSIVASETLRRASEQDMVTTITAYANLVVCTVLMAPFAFCQGIAPLKDPSNRRALMVVALFSAFEHLLTNASLYFINASLKAALHSFNVVLTLLVSALADADSESRACVLHCRWRERRMLVFSVLLISGGGAMTGLLASRRRAAGSHYVGNLLQLASSLAFAARTVAARVLLCRDGGRSSDSVEGSRLLSPTQLAFFVSPIKGLLLLVCALCTEDKAMNGCWWTAAVVGLAVTGTSVLVLRLTQLVTPTTVATLGVVKNIGVVMFFLTARGESFKPEQRVSFAVTLVGVVSYACAARGNALEGLLRKTTGLGRSDSATSLGSAVEQQGIALDRDL